MRKFQMTAQTENFMPKIEYSCKRKKDFVTYFAIIFFLGICAFEFYLILILPIQLKHHDAMVYQVKKQEMVLTVELVKWHVSQAKPKNPLQTSEVQLISECINQISGYLRRNLKNLSYSQVMEIHSLVNRIEATSRTWEKKGYLFKENEFDMVPFMKNMEAELDKAEKDKR